MAKRMPKFEGFALADIAEANIEEQNSNVKNGNAKNSIAILKTKPVKMKSQNSITDISNAINSSDKFNNDKNSIAKNVNQALFARVRDYLYQLLGNNDSVEVKFGEVIKELDINPHSFYKYMRTLKETDFIVTKLRYSTEITKRSAKK